MQRIRRQHLAILRMHRLCYYRTIAASHAHRHHHGLGHARRPVIHRRIRNLHPRQLADHRLELEQRLQRPLRNLRLIRCITRQKLAARYHRINKHWPIVPVSPRAQKARIARSILLGKRLEVLDHLLLAMLPRNIQITRQPVLGRNRGKQIVNRRNAYLGEHLRAVRRGLRQIAHLFSVRSLR